MGREGEREREGGRKGERKRDRTATSSLCHDSYLELQAGCYSLRMSKLDSQGA